MVCFIKITRGNKIFTKFHPISCKLKKSKYLNKMRKSTSLVARPLFPTPKKSAQFRVYVFKLKRKPIKSDSRIPSRNRRDFLLLIHPLTKSMCVQRNFFHASFRHSACLSPNATSKRYTIKSLTKTINKNIRLVNFKKLQSRTKVYLVSVQRNETRKEQKKILLRTESDPNRLVL